MNIGDVRYVSANASQLQLQSSEVFSAADGQLYQINRKKMTFVPHGISLFTEVELFVHLCTICISIRPNSLSN